MIVETLVFGTTKVEISLDDSRDFVAGIGERRFREASYNDLVEALKKEAKRQKVEHAIPLVMFYNGLYRRAVCRGRHAGRSAYLITLEDGSKEVLSSPTVVGLGREISDDEVRRLNELRAAAKAAEKAETDFVDTLGGIAYSAALGKIVSEREAAVLAEGGGDASA